MEEALSQSSEVFVTGIAAGIAYIESITYRDKTVVFNDGKMGDQYDEQVACIHMADRIANILELGVPTRFIVQRPDPAIWDFLKVQLAGILMQ